MQAGDGGAAQADFQGARAHQRRDLVGRLARLRVERDRRAARVVAVKAIADVDIRFRLAPRTGDHAQAGAEQMVAGRARIFRPVAAHVEAVGVRTQAGHGAQRPRPARAVFAIHADARFDDMVLPRGRHDLALARVVQAIVDIVVLQLHADGGVAAAPVRVAVPGVAGVEAGRHAPVGLGELVAVDRVVHRIRKIREQRQAVGDHIRAEPGRHVVRGLAPGARQAVALRLAAVAGIDGVEAAQATFPHGAQRNLVGGIPAGVVRHGRDVDTVVGIALTVAQHDIALAVAVRLRERAIVMLRFERVQQAAVARVKRIGQQGAAKAVLPDAQAGDALRQAVRVDDGRRAGRGKIALRRRIPALFVIEAHGQFGDQEVQVRPALAVAVAALVDGHLVDGGAQVRAVIEVEAAQVELVGLAFAAMLADDQPRHGFEQFAGPVAGACVELLLRDAARVGRIGHAQLVQARTVDQHALEDVVGVGGR